MLEATFISLASFDYSPNKNRLFFLFMPDTNDYLDCGSICTKRIADFFGDKIAYSPMVSFEIHTTKPTGVSCIKCHFTENSSHNRDYLNINKQTLNPDDTLIILDTLEAAYTTPYEEWPSHTFWIKAINLT